LFGLILLMTAVKLLANARAGQEYEVDVARMRSVRLLRRVMPVTAEYHGPRLTVRAGARRALTPLAVVVTTMTATDVVFAMDSVPAVYGVTGDPYLVFVTNAFALLGLRALYFVLHAALARLVHLAYGLAAILAFIGVKLVLHWAHGIWDELPQIPTAASLAVIVLTLASVTATSLWATRGAAESDSAAPFSAS
jgi:TerC family integral membrane protein